MGKPSKWLRKLLGVKKKSSSKESPAKRSDDIQEKSREKHGWCIGASDSSNRTGGLQQIPAAQPKEPTAIVEISEKSPNPHVEVEETIASAIEASPNLAWTTKEKQREEQAAIKIQTAFRAYLAQRALCALKGLVRLQALVRGHLTRKEAAVALRTTLSIVKVQAHIRGYNVRRSKVGQVLLKQRKSRRQNEGEFWAITDTRNAIFLNTTFQHQLFIYAPGQYMLFSSSRPSGWAWLERWTASEVWVTALRASEIDDGENNARPTWSLKGNTDFSSGFQDWSTQNAFPDLHEQYISPVKSHASNGFHHYNGSDHSHLSKHSSPHSLQQKGEVNHQLVGSDGGSSNNLGHENGFSNGKQLHKHIEQNGFASSKDNFNCPSPSSKPSVKRGAIKAESAEGAMQGTHAIPSYMATTQSSKAKVRVNSPKNKSDNEERSPQTMKRRFSLPGSNGRIHSETTRPRRLSLQAEA